MIEARGLSKRYGRVLAVDRLIFDVRLFALTEGSVEFRAPERRP